MTTTRIRRGMVETKTDRATTTTTAAAAPSGRELSKLAHWDELPEWQRDNHYIHSGYVRETSSFVKCLHSLLYVHNETGNIYSHFIPSIICAAVGLLALDVVVPVYSTTSWGDRVAFAVFCTGCILCLGLSTTFHTLKSHSDKISALGNKLDYLGIVFMIEASMVSLIYYGFFEHHNLRNGLWTVISFFGAICAVVSLNDTFRSPDWRAFRASMFVAYGLSGVLPVLVGWYAMGGQEVAQRIQLGWIILEGVLYVGGATLYAMRVPERFSPGKFDLWGHSHQLFHLLVVAAALSHGTALVRSYEYVHTYLI